ncbi:hypothetical protein SAMN04487897_110115 [Paenibacillus sp. yr247]|uniref:hypothetical protein n=1 Tax=Paenibacillus sp. yr247 TaxID=1761880 RepID=UPI00088C3516|nr:hypothetical protein [Paenibacillus sp. yr247]SDO24768.1 hypothetical protein SAMN04487897_110115 [Paenibacillus sp. yr247]
MSFRNQAQKMIGKSVQVQLTNGRTLTGKLTSVGTDFMIMHVRIGRRIRRINIRLAEILLLFLLFGL